MASYRDLEIYQMAHRLAVELHKLTLGLPKFEMYEEGSQVRRSSKSVSTNIVEGYGRRRYQNEYIRYLVFSHSSCEETIEHLEFLFETESLKDKELYDYFFKEYNNLGGKINRFIQAVEKR